MEELLRGELDDNGELKAEYVNEAIKRINTNATLYDKYNKYYKGLNTGLDTYLLKYIKNSVTYNSYYPIKNPISQVVIRAIKSYMYKAGLITTEYDPDIEIQPNMNTKQKNALREEKQLEADNIMVGINTVYWNNNEDTLTSETGENTLINGRAYELIYIKGNGNIQASIDDIRIVEMPANQVVLVYDKSLENNVIAGVRYYHDEVDKIHYTEIYYKDQIVFYNGSEKNFDSDTTIENKRLDHIFGEVPIIEYKNNSEGISDIGLIIPYNDALDINITEIVRENSNLPFSHAEHQSADGRDMEDTADKQEIQAKIKSNQTTLTESVNGELVPNITYHVRNAPVDLMKFLIDLCLDMMERVTGIPDLRNILAVQHNTKSLDTVLYGYETVAEEKELYFKKGLYKRNELICNALNQLEYNGTIDIKNIKVKFERNKPKILSDMIDNIIKLVNIVSEKDLLKMLAPLIQMDANVLEDNKKLEAENAVEDSYNISEVNNGLQNEEETQTKENI